jgi:hypothetical protein
MLLEQPHQSSACQDHFSYPSLITFLFATPPIKLKWGLQKGRGLLIASHLDNHYDSPIRNREQQSNSYIYLLHSLLVGAQLCCTFYQPPKTVQFCWVKSHNHFPEPNPCYSNSIERQGFRLRLQLTIITAMRLVLLLTC